jgi:ferritin
MSSFFRALSLNGFARWMKAQSQREMMHAMKIYEFLPERGGCVVLEDVAQPSAEWDSALAAAEEAYRHEQDASGMINDLVDLALVEHAHATNVFLQWFVNEQVEEEARLRAIVEKLKLVGEDPYGLFLIDRDMGKA